MQSHWLHTAKQLDKSHYTQSGCYSSNDFNSSVVAQAVKEGKKKKITVQIAFKIQMLKAASISLS